MSPWTPHGAGLISEGGLLFGEECCGALLRGLNSALGTLRNFGKAFREPFIDPSMHKSNGPLDFGTLVALMYYCVSEIQRNPDITRLNLYYQVVENCLQLAITHLSMYEERSVLESGFRNEVANKLSTVVGRLRKVVPPMPTYSLVHTEEIDPFIQSLQQLL